MIVVINAGGSGSRLWPLSTPDYPKHLLKVQGSESLIQDAYKRAARLSDKIYIVTEAGHAHHVQEQLPDLQDDAFIIEPARRGTAGAMIAGLHHIQARHDHDEPIAFIHADHVIRDVEGFAYSFHAAAAASTERKCVTLIGIEPTHPSTGFGYIQKGASLNADEESLVYDVQGFKEKPDLEVAQGYLQSGQYLWNCGYFVGSVNTFADAFTKYSPEWRANYDALLQATPATYKDTYLSFENDAIDYALVERDKELQVVPANFDWLDVGSFGDMHQAVLSDAAGNYVNGKVQTEEVKNSFIRNEEDKPVAVIGLENVVVVNTPAGILIARKDLSQKVKEVVARFNADAN